MILTLTTSHSFRSRGPRTATTSYPSPARAVGRSSVRGSYHLETKTSTAAQCGCLSIPAPRTTANRRSCHCGQVSPLTSRQSCSRRAKRTHAIGSCSRTSRRNERGFWYKTPSDLAFPTSDLRVRAALVLQPVDTRGVLQQRTDADAVAQGRAGRRRLCDLQRDQGLLRCRYRRRRSGVVRVWSSSLFSSSQWLTQSLVQLFLPRCQT